MPETITPEPVKHSWSVTMLASLHNVPRRFWFGAAAVLALFASSLIQLVAFSLSGSQLEAIAAPLRSSGYGEYLLALLAEGR